MVVRPGTLCILKKPKGKNDDVQTYRPGIMEKYCVETVERGNGGNTRRKFVDINSKIFLKDNLVD